MKNYLVSVVAVFSFLMMFGTVSTSAQSTGCLTAQIPFIFAAMDRVFTEGTYRICPAPAIQKLFSLQNYNDKTLGFVNPLAVDSRDAHKPPALMFHRYGNSYFLSEIRTPSLLLELERSKAEKEIRRSISSKQAGPTTVTVSLSAAPGTTKS